MDLLGAVWQWILEHAQFTVLAVIVAAFLITKVRDAILTTLLGGAYARIVAPDRAEAARRELQRAQAAALDARDERLRGAIGVLEEALTQPMHSIEAATKLQQAISELELEGPAAELRPLVDQILHAAEVARTAEDPFISVKDQRALMRPLTQALGAFMRRGA